MPLSARVLAILEEMKPLHHVGDGQDDGPPSCFGGKQGQPLSNMALLMLLRRMKHDDRTTAAYVDLLLDFRPTAQGVWLAS